MAGSAPTVDRFQGRVLAGRYRLLDRIGQGASGRVYRALQEPMGREVAVKLMQVTGDGEQVHDTEVRFLREAALAGRIQHPHVVTVHDFGRTPEGDCFIVMEHLKGRTLRSVLASGALPVPQALRIAEQLLLGLRAVHRAGLVHRDVKPSNIILLRADDGGDFVKLFDFGLVKGDDEVTISVAGAMMGTPHYIAPEQARGLEADARSDLYAAGAVTWRMLTGSLPFQADNPLAVAAMHIHEPLPAMADRAPEREIPAAVEAWVRGLMEKDPAARPQDADQALAGLQRVRGELGLGEEPTVRVQGEGSLSAGELAAVRASGQPEGERRPLGSGLGWVAALGGLGVVLAGLLLFRLLQPPPPAEAAPELEVPTAPAGAAPVQAPAGGIESSVDAAAPAAPLGPQEPVGEPPADDLREVILLISSEPADAEVWLGEQLLGRTPLARGLSLPAAERVPTTLRLRRKGHRSAELRLDLGQERVTGHAVLVPSPPSGGAAAEGERPASGSLTVDGVRFSPAQAAAALTWINQADADALRAAGITGRQANIVLDQRPFASLHQFGETPYIGEKTVEKVLAQVQAAR